MAVRTLTPALLAAVQRGLQSHFKRLYEGIEIGDWEKLFTRVPSDGAGENYPVMGAVPQMQPFEGTRVYGGVRTDGFYVTNVHYDSAISIPKEDIERDKLGRYDALIARMAEKAKTYVVELLAAILANATSTTLAKCWDDKALISATHGQDGGKNQSNIVTGSGADTVAHVNADLSQVLAVMSQWKDDKGTYVRGIAPSAIIYPAGNSTLREILEVISGGLQELGAPNRSRLVQSIIAEPTLTGNSWYAVSTMSAMKVFGFQEEVPPTGESAYDFDTKALKFGVEMRGAAFCMDWMQIVKVNNT